MANITPQLNKILSAVYGEEVRGSIHDALVAMNGESSNAMEHASTAQDSATNSATAAATSASNAAQSATNASTSAGRASESATTAQNTVTEVGQIKSDIETLVTNATASINASATQAANSATAASSSASGAGESANRASSSATSSESYAKGGTGTRTGEDSDNAKFYSQQASTSATNAATSETNAAKSATDASTSAESASTNATLAESYTKGGTGTRQGESTDNAKYYKDLAKSYAESAAQGIEPATTTKLGGVKPDGTTITVDQDGTIHGSAQVNVATTTAAGIVKPDGTTITVDNDGTIHGVGGSNVSVDGNTIVKDGNNAISVNEYVGTKAQADANLDNIPDGATVYTTDEGGELSVIDTELNASSNHAIANSTVTTALNNKATKNELTALANKSDITNISITGTTNNTGSNILAGTLFYWNGKLYKATTDIPNGSTFVTDSNCSPWTVFIEMGLMFSKTDNLTVTNNNSSLDNCTSLASVWQAVKWNYINGYGKICKSGIGALGNTRVKNVISPPANFGNYVSLVCKFEATEEIIAIYAKGEFDGKLAKCYLFKNRADYYLTDWQILR